MSESLVSKGGVYLFALATIAAGVLDLIWGEFEAAHQPIGALGDNIPGQKIFAYITAVWMILAGAAILGDEPGVLACWQLHSSISYLDCSGCHASIQHQRFSVFE